MGDSNANGRYERKQKTSRICNCKAQGAVVLYLHKSPCCWGHCSSDLLRNSSTGAVALDHLSRPGIGLVWFLQMRNLAASGRS